MSVAVASGLLNTRKLMTALERGEVRYDFVEIMACPGGCAGGGGQPIHDGVELAEKRGSVLWNIDKAAPSRFSHENPEVHELYREFMKSPSATYPTICFTPTIKPGKCPAKSNIPSKVTAACPQVAVIL